MPQHPGGNTQALGGCLLSSVVYRGAGGRFVDVISPRYVPRQGAWKTVLGLPNSPSAPMRFPHPPPPRPQVLNAFWKGRTPPRTPAHHPRSYTREKKVAPRSGPRLVVSPLAILPVGCAPRSGSGRWWWVGIPPRGLWGGWVAVPLRLASAAVALLLPPLRPWVALAFTPVGFRLLGGWLAVCAYFGSTLPCRVSGSPLAVPLVCWPSRWCRPLACSYYRLKIDELTSKNRLKHRKFPRYFLCLLLLWSLVFPVLASLVPVPRRRLPCRPCLGWWVLWPPVLPWWWVVPVASITRSGWPFLLLRCSRRPALGLVGVPLPPVLWPVFGL
jgi:hypothetical protein